MHMKKYIVALDQGTTSSRAIIFDKDRKIISVKQQEFNQIFPKPGYVEHDPGELFGSQMAVLHEVLAASGVRPDEIAAIGITNQRETTIVWDKNTGIPVYNAIVWQCRRTTQICEELKNKGFEEIIREKTGLLIDAYFSAAKIKWILDNVPGAREKAEKGELLFGTVDTWLVWKMTQGRAHVTDYTNASRTMLFNIKELKWDKELLDIFEIPASMLPEVRSSSEVYGAYNIQGVEVPVAGIAGDQQAALFGQACFEKGQAKNTYGTGCFLLMNMGKECKISEGGLITTIGIGLKNKIEYAMEGSVFVGGAVIQWLRDELGILESAPASEAYSEAVRDNGGVYFVPAFTGLGAPYWDMYARGAIMGITRGTKREHIIRAAVESMGFQSMELIKAIEQESGIKLTSLKVDGGASQNEFLMQFQADIANVKIIYPKITESTALGAACLAGLAVGMWDGIEELSRGFASKKEFLPKMEDARRSEMIKKWKKAVSGTLNWEK